MSGIWSLSPSHRRTTAHTHDLLSSLFLMAYVVEARDPYTGGHLWRVSQYSRLIAETLGSDPSLSARATLGGFLHDLGKVGIPDSILNKPGRLTDDEYSLMKTHPERGAALLTGHPLAAVVEDAVLLHHERPDGRGYPNGFSGDLLPMVARIVGVADAFDAMTSRRPYRDGMPTTKALLIIEEGTGTQFDTDCAAALLELAERGQLAGIIGHRTAASPASMPGLRPDHRGSQPRQTGRPRLLPALRQRGGAGEAHAGLIPTGTGRRGSPHDREPRPDVYMMRALIKTASAHLG